MHWQFRPARDLGLSPRERLRSAWRERSLGGLGINLAWRQVARLFLRWRYGLRVEGIPPVNESGFVLVANHASHLDAMILVAALRGPEARRTYVLAAADAFFAALPQAAFFAYALNTLSVSRTKPSPRTLVALRTRLIEDRLIYVVFPEGTRSRDGTMGQFRAGVGLLLAGTAVPLVPCWIEGAFHAWPPDRRWPRSGRVRLRVGAALRFDDVANTARGWAEVAQAAEEAVRSLARS